MPEQYDATERALSDTLHTHGDVLGSADLPRVYGRARSIRRRRTAGAVVAAAAAVAVIATPVAVLNRGTDSPAPPVASQATSTAPSSPATSPSETTAAASSLADLPVGRAPGIGYAHGRTWFNNDGSTQPLPDTGILAITPYHGGWLVLTDQQSGDNGVLAWFDNTGKQGWSHQTPATPVVGPDVYNPYWTTVAGGTTTLHTGIASGMSDAEQTQQVPGVDRVVGVLPDGRAVFTNTASRDGAWATDLTSAPVRLPGLAMALSASYAEPLVAGFSSGSDIGSVVVDVQSGKTLWSTSAVLGRFSPDAHLVIGYDEATGTPGMYDAHHGGTPLCTAPQLANLSVGTLQWEDATHVLAPVTDQDGQSAIVRLGLTRDGGACQLERAKTADGISPTSYVLALQP